MNLEQTTLVAILALAIAGFIWGRFRHDLVALAALLAAAVAGLVPAAQAFAGFGHPAVVTVAAVLVLSGALQRTGVVDEWTRRLLPSEAGPSLTIAVLCGFVAFLSSFMNNIGALALVMPAAIQAAARLGVPPGRLLMPVSFASLLGGMTTLIGTPPNLIVSGFRAEATGAPFAMFDFSLVGVPVALAGVAFISLLGWRLVPRRDSGADRSFDIGAYLTEARVPEKAKAAGMPLAEIEAALAKADAQVVGFIRDGERVAAPDPRWRARPGDILVLEAEPRALASALSGLGLVIEEAKAAEEEGAPRRAAAGAELRLVELVLRPGSPIAGLSAADIQLRRRHGVSLLAISRQGRRSVARLRQTRFAAGDVLLLQGPPQALAEFAAAAGAVPLAERPLALPDRKRGARAAGIFAGAVAAAASGLLSPALAFAGGALLVVAARVLPVRRLYEDIDWSVIVLLGALMPVAAALETTGAAALLAGGLLALVGPGSPALVLLVLMACTVVLTDVMNNAATAAVMCPIAIGAAGALGVSPDAFLMGVGIASSCAFNTPIGHQNNTLILGPGGFRFGDYWRMGLPLELLVLAVSVPLLLVAFPP
ncbi:MAG: SLC13 family permease [Acetobacteraceae bacterium]|nr:SLC13 family permease [Acetobacteraceae bacterium]